MTIQENEGRIDMRFQKDEKDHLKKSYFFIPHFFDNFFCLDNKIMMQYLFPKMIHRKIKYMDW